MRIDRYPTEFYTAYGCGDVGAGERLHQHTVGQTFTLLKGTVRRVVAGVEQDVRAPAQWFVDARVEHGFTVLEDDTHWLSAFGYWQPDGTLAPLDWTLIEREQVPSLSTAEIAERKEQIAWQQRSPRSA